MKRSDCIHDLIYFEVAFNDGVRKTPLPFYGKITKVTPINQMISFTVEAALDIEAYVNREDSYCSKEFEFPEQHLPVNLTMISLKHKFHYLKWVKDVLDAVDEIKK